MLPQNKPDRIRILFDDHRLVANAGLLLPATLARHLGLRELVDHHLDLGGAPGRANTGDKMLTLVASALAGGDCIDDADALRAGGTVGVLGCVVKAPSTLGTFLRSFRWGHVRQLDRVSRQLLARAWAAGAGPGDSPLTIDLDSTICETYGLAQEGARHHGYTGARGYHPLLAIAAGTGEVLMSAGAGPGDSPLTIDLDSNWRPIIAALNHMPSGRFAANGAWLAVQEMAHNLARWTARIGLGERTVITKTLRRRVFALVGRITRSARRLTLHLPRRWPWETQFSRALARLQAIPFPA